MNAVLDLDPAFPIEEASKVPYFRGELGRDYCGEFRTSSFNGRNSETDPGAWTWTGPVSEMQEEIRQLAEGS